MSVSNLAEARLLNALSAFAAAVGSGQDTSEKAGELRRVIRNTDEATIDSVIGQQGVTIDDAVQGVVKFSRAAVDFADMISRLRR